MNHIGVIVTGVAGYFGSVLASTLLSRGVRVYGVDRLDYSGESLLGIIAHPNFTFHRLDMRTDRQFKQFADVVSNVSNECLKIVVINLAAVVGESACLWNEGDAQKTNRDFVRELAFLPVEIIQASTCSNYGRSTDECTEGSPLAPLSLYAETKIQAEEDVRNAGGTILRFATLCGPSPRMRFDLLINDIGAAIVDHRHVSIFSPDSYRPFLHIQDAADVVANIVARMKNGAWHKGEIYNVVGFNIQKRTLAEMSEGFGLKVLWGEDLPKDRDYRVSGRKLTTVLGPHSYKGPALCLQDCIRAASLCVEKRWTFTNWGKK